MQTRSKWLLLIGILTMFFITACALSQRGTGDTPPQEPAKPKPVSPTKPSSGPGKAPTATKPPAVSKPGNTISRQPAEPDEDFSWSTVNEGLPKDILEEISFFGAGGGKYCLGDEKRPMVTYEPRDEELMTLSTMIACGWDANEVLTGTIRYPNGETITRSIETKVDIDGYYGVLGFKPDIDDPAGVYLFRLEGKNGSVEENVRFSKPNGPRLFRYENGNLLLYGFSPREAVRLFLYFEKELAAWQEYKVDGDGRLVIRFLIPNRYDPEDTIFVAVGDTSGEAHLKFENHFGASSDLLKGVSVQKIFCGGEYSRLTLLNFGYVAYTDGADMRIRKKPGFTQEILSKVPEGTAFKLLDGPRCVENVFWWKVETDSKESGWMAEFQDGVFLLAPGFPAR